MKKRNIPFSPPDITNEEVKLVTDALLSGWITTGPKTKLFEDKLSEYSGTNKTVALNSATAAMEMTLRLLGVGPGDEVITSAYTYTASASVIFHVGAKIVMIDTQKDSVEMDYDQLASKITDKTKAIIPVDIAGIMIDYDKLYEVIESKKDLFKPTTDLQKHIGRIAVIADAAHSVGAKYKGKPNGTVADFTCYSFHAVKNLTTAEGGSVTWNKNLGLNDDEIYQGFQLLSLHGQNKDALAKTKLGSWEYDIIYPAYKCNMTDIVAAIGLVQFDRYEGLIARRNEIVSMYNEGLDKIGVSYLDHTESSAHLYITRVPGISLEQRNEIIEIMAESGIACNVHYKPLPMMTAYKNLGFDIKDYPNAYDYYHNAITLPLHTNLSDEDVEYVLDNFEKAIDKVKNV